VTLTVVLLGAIFAGVAWFAKQAIGALVGQQVRGSVPDYAARKARSAAKRLPEGCRKQIEEEWLAELAMLDSKPLTAIKYAHGLVRAATEISYQAGSHCSPTRGRVFASRARDFGWSAIALFIFAPLLMAISSCAAVLNRGRRPILSRISEPGQDGKPFNRLRFTTIKRLPDGSYAHTGLGLFLSRLSLAKLPSLINVLRGDLALVGPPSPFEIAQFLDEDEFDALAGDELFSPRVRPGLISWQLLVASGHLKMSRVEARFHDEHRTLRADLALLARAAQIAVTVTPKGD
jgi:lipopolysaccharide/colanic/teichoic acid biosynthesis glycosyltransferase